MKTLRVLCLTACLVFAGVAAAQTEEELVAASEKICECMKRKGKTGLTKEELKKELTLCMLTECAEMISVEGDEEARQKKNYELGLEIGKKMANICPQMFVTESDGYSKDAVNGTVTDVVINGDIATLLIKEGKKYQHRVLLLEPVAGVNEWAGDLRKLIGKKVWVEYSVIDIYSAGKKEYITQKVLKKLKIE